MERTTALTEQKLLRALMQFKRLGWHHQSIAGCKPSEIRVLFCLKRGMSPYSSEMKVSDISKHLHVTPPTITQLLNGLEASGLIERHIDATDRRAVGVTLTKKGELVTQQAEDAFSASLRGLIDYLGEEQSNQLADLLFKVFRYFNEKEASVYDERWHGVKEA
jgi:DNA-binding MarR family transcriptional regulator